MRLFYLSLFLIGVLAVILVSFVRGTGGGDDFVLLDDDLCPVDAALIRQKFVALFDLQKPLGTHGALPGEILRQVTSRMGRHGELRVFSLAGDAFASRKLIARVCKPYDNADLVAEGAKDSAVERRDCDDLPAQLPSKLRERARTFCQRRDGLVGRLALQAGRARQRVADAHIAEAIEDAQLELAGGGDASLFVLSDLMQHAEWYSHLDREPDDWDYDAFAYVRATSPAPISVTAPAAPNLDVTLFYLRRAGVTEHPRNVATHKQFWTRYFAGRVRTLTFEDQAPLLDYDHVAFDDRAAQDDVERLRAEREEAQRLLREVEAEKRVLDEAREELAALEERRQAREREQLARQRREAEIERASPAAPARATDVEQAPVGSALQAVQGRAEQTPEGERAQVSGISSLSEPAEPQSVPTSSVDPVPPSSPALTPVADAAELTVANPATEAAPTMAGPAQPPVVRAQEASPCAVQLRTGAGSVYPGSRRIDYGSANVVVSYAIDEQGRTIDDQVQVVLSQSSADRPHYLDVFVEAAEAAVRDWEFDFTERDCRRSQQRMTRFRFAYR